MDKSLKRVYGIELFLSKQFKNHLIFQNEFWKEVKQSTNGRKYLISSLGRLKTEDSFIINRLTGGYSRRKGVLIQGWVDKGYKKCLIRTLKTKYTYFLYHRLVALAFLESEPNRLHVNHKNGNRLDNRLSNLEWCTPKENVHHAINTLNKKSYKEILVLDLETGIYYNSAKEAFRYSSYNKTYQISTLSYKE